MVNYPFVVYDGFNFIISASSVLQIVPLNFTPPLTIYKLELALPSIPGLKYGVIAN